MSVIAGIDGFELWDDEEDPMDQRGAVPLGGPAAAAEATGAPQQGKGRCSVTGCGFVGPVEEVQTISDRMAWHVYTRHPLLWKTLSGGAKEPPVDQPKGPLQ